MDDQQLYEANYHLHVEGLVEELYGELLRMFDHMVDGDDMVSPRTNSSQP